VSFCKLLPICQISLLVGGCKIDGAGPPENPPPAAIIPTLTPIPSAENMAVAIATFCLGDTFVVEDRGLFKYRFLILFIGDIWLIIH
jgi:hypothetical protein